jgi:drug/metabolite transporter (DMT)-like permease
MAQRAGLVATVASGILFGTSVAVIKLGLSRALIPPFLFAALRFLVASVLIVLLLRRTGWVNTSLLRSRPMWTIGIINTVGYILQFEGQVLATASDAALIIGSAALMVPIISRLRRAERLDWKRSLGVLLGFVGAALVVTRGESLSLGSSQVLGDLLILGTAVTIALIFVFTKRLVDERGGKAVTGGIVITTCILLLPFTPLDLTSPLGLGLEAWFYILFLSVFATVGAYYFFAKGLETVTPTVSSIILPIEVIVSVFLSVLIFRDPFNLFSGTGAVLIILGVLLVSLSS